jgi:hypothetical protein
MELPRGPKPILQHFGATKVADPSCHLLLVPIGSSRSPPTGLSHDLALETSRKRGRAQTSYKGIRTPPPSHVTGLVPWSPEIQYG